MEYTFKHLGDDKYISTYGAAKLEITLVENKVYKDNIHIGTWDYNKSQIRWIGNVLMPLVSNGVHAWDWFHKLNHSLCKVIPLASDLACVKHFQWL